MASTSEDPSLKEKEQPQEQQEQQAEQMNEEGVEHEEEVCGNCSFPAGSVHKHLIGEGAAELSGRVVGGDVDVETTGEPRQPHNEPATSRRPPSLSRTGSIGWYDARGIRKNKKADE